MAILSQSQCVKEIHEQYYDAGFLRSLNAQIEYLAL